jgi:uncharacterized protein (DUF1330 family)
MTAYVIANVDIRDTAAYAEYVKLAPATVAAFGGHYIARGGRSETLEGDVPAKRLVILQFETYEKARAWYDSEGYRVARAIRQSASTGSFMLVEGTP